MEKKFTISVKLVSMALMCLLSVAVFAGIKANAATTVKTAKDKSVAIFVDKSTYASLKTEIGRLKSDISTDLNAEVFIFSKDWKNASEIKSILVDKYKKSSLIGSVLIGNIPAQYINGVPTDTYYQDLIEGYQVSMETWTGRIKPPVGGSEGIKLLRNYLNRNHNYRIGKLTYKKEMLYFGSIAINQDKMSEKDYKNMVSQIGGYTGLYASNQVKPLYGTDTTKEKSDYLKLLSQNREFVFVNIHGAPTLQWIGGNTYISSSEIKKAAPNALFTVMASCSNGNFTQDNYFAGWYLFSGNSLVVTANSVDSMLVGGTELDFLKDYKPLSLGVTFGEMHKNDRSNLVTQIFGDPTLSLRKKPTKNIPQLNISKSSLDFGSTTRGSQPSINIVFTNKGNQTLKLEFIKPAQSINGKALTLEYWDIFYYTVTDGTFRSFEVPPGKSKTVPFTFYPRKDGPVGKYAMQMLLQTNDPIKPYLVIDLKGVAK